MKRLILSVFLAAVLTLAVVPVTMTVDTTGIGLSVSEAHAFFWPQWVIDLVNDFCDVHPDFPGCDGCMYC